MHKGFIAPPPGHFTHTLTCRGGHYGHIFCNGDAIENQTVWFPFVIWVVSQAALLGVVNRAIVNEDELERNESLFSLQETIGPRRIEWQG
jgi:hypothetical protein